MEVFLILTKFGSLKITVKKYNIKKIFTVFLISISASFIAGIYGAFHDQLTYTISPEYYTKFKFIQFNIINESNSSKITYIRFFVAIVGFLATWWFGLILGFILALIGLVHKDWKTMYKVSLKSIFLALIVVFIFGLIGLFYGRFILSNQPISHFQDWFIPKNLIDYKNFISVASMHNFSYVGGIFGLIIGSIYSFKNRNSKPETCNSQ